MEQEYVTVGELREQLGISKATMARLIKEEVVPVVENEFDKRIKLVRKQDAERVIEEARRKGKGAPVAA